MLPTIAAAVFAVGILYLFALDRATNPRISKAAWIPTIWFSLASSRAASQWLMAWGLSSSAGSIDSTAQYMEGSPIDRFVLAALVLSGIVIVVKRREKFTSLLRANPSIVLFLLYCFVSILWSDFPGVAFKRWTKLLGDLTMVLVILTELNPIEAVKRILIRVGFVMLPLSILFIKYYPSLGREYMAWTWTPSYTGVTTGKNLLGLICLIYGLGSVWRLLQEFSRARGTRRTAPVVAHGALIIMALYLFNMTNSMTSLSCLILASLLIAATYHEVLTKEPLAVHWLMATVVLVPASVLFLNIGSGLLDAMGRDATLTGRTDLWALTIGMTGNPLFGTGFESYWLGSRLERIWNLYWWRPNEAHNGYLETYLNLGWIGVGLLITVVITGYRNVIAAFRRNRDEGSLRLAYFATGLVYNFTESAFRILNPVWIFFLLAIINVPEGWTESRVPQEAATEKPWIKRALSKPTLKPEKSRSNQTKAEHQYHPHNWQCLP